MNPSEGAVTAAGAPIQETIAVRLHRSMSDFTLDVNLSFPLRGISVFFGASGSGKTSVLRSIAGLTEARGTLRVGGEVWQDDDRRIFVPAHRRSLGYVFQESSLFSHLSVRGNLDYGRQRAANPLTDRELETALDLLGIDHLLHRTPDRLSGGERQRVAMARALATRPRVLLMDEPMASLDERRKAELFPYLERLHEEHLVPILYVSHSIQEVARLADHMIVLDGGSAIANGPVDEIMARLDMAHVFGEEEGVVLDARVDGNDDDGLTRLSVAGGHLLIVRRNEMSGQTVRCRIHARDVSIALARSQETSILNILAATIEALQSPDERSPGQVLVRLRLYESPTVILARVSERSVRQLRLSPGMHVFAQIKSVALLT